MEQPEALIMAKPTREYCLAKIAELEEKIRSCSEEDRPNFLAVLDSWRYLAERAGGKDDERS
jgi:hypothetical protein